MTPEIDTYRRYIREKITQLHESVGGLSQADLNRAPDLTGANSPYVIVTHTLGNMRAWVLGIVCGQDLRRDRPAEFRSSGEYPDLKSAAVNFYSEIDAALEQLDADTLGDRFVPAQELWGEGKPREIARRDGFAHVLEHAGIHLGHLQMTLALLRKDGTPGHG